MVAVAYLRKSRVTTDRHVSWEVQEAKVRELARAQGDDDPLLLADWNKSGTLGAADRPGYRRLVEMIENGEATAVYAYSLSRLGRSVPELRRVIDLCVKHDVPVLFADGEPREVRSTWGKFMLNILGSVAELEADIAKDRARDAVEARRTRGDLIGPSFYGSKDGEDLDAVVAAFREAGSYQGAAVRLNDRGVPTRQGKPWKATSVRVILIRVAPELAPPKGHRGAAAGPKFRLARLLRCPYEGKLLSGSMSDGRVRYVCAHAYAVRGHGPRSIAESHLLPWLVAETSRLHTPDRVELAADGALARSELDARRGRVLDMYEAGAIGRDEWRRRLGMIDDEMQRLDRERMLVDVPAIDLEHWPADQVNRVLRTLWDYVELDAQLMPVRAEWLVPEWRGEVQSPAMERKA